MAGLNNAAAWINEPKAYPLEVKASPATKPGPREILVRNRAIAFNPIDAILQKKARFPLTYPTIIGQDVAGDVVEVGKDVTRFKSGDRVLGHAVGISTHRLEDNAFQSLTVLLEHMSTELPASVSYKQAAVVPLGLSTASCGLFQETNLALQLPSEPRRAATGSTLLVWGGSTSVGSNAVQAAVAAGYEVFATASARNSEYVRGLGAAQVFDYKSPTIVADILSAFEGKTCAGAMDCAGGDATVACCEIVKHAQGAKTVSTVLGGTRGAPVEGVKLMGIFGTTLKDNAVGSAIYQDYLPKALAGGTFVPSPSPMVVGHGLESVQKGIDTIEKGVSAQKVVVTL